MKNMAINFTFKEKGQLKHRPVRTDAIQKHLLHPYQQVLAIFHAPEIIPKEERRGPKVKYL